MRDYEIRHGVAGRGNRPEHQEILDLRYRLLDKGMPPLWIPKKMIRVSDIPVLDYQQHLFQERTLTSTTSNTRADGLEFLAFADQHGLEVTTQRYPLDRAGDALADLAADRVTGAAVLLPG